MSEIQKVRDAIQKLPDYIEGEYVVMSKRAVAIWHAVSGFVGGVIGTLIHKFFLS